MFAMLMDMFVPHIIAAVVVIGGTYAVFHDDGNNGAW